MFVSLLVAGCVEAGSFHCSTNSQCGAGTCETAGLCSFPDVHCPSGRSYGDYAGDLAGTCTVQETASPPDAATAGVDAGADATQVQATNLLLDPGFEQQTGTEVGAPWVENWMTTEVENNGGNHNVFQAPPPNSSVEMYQTITVVPNTAYVYTAQVNTRTASTSPTSGDAFILWVRATNGNTIVEDFPLPITSNGYITRTVNFNSGANSQVEIWVKTWNNDAAQGQTWMRADNLNVHAQ
jgi:hypothetical protein